VETIWITQLNAWNETISWHTAFPPVAAYAQISLSSRVDYDEWATPIADAIAVWTHYKTADGPETPIHTLTSTFYAYRLTEVKGMLISRNCYSGAIINYFVWSRG